MVKIKSIKYVGKEDVYNMEVKDFHNFSINGGLIVHNCMDAFRYVVNGNRLLFQRLLSDLTKTPKKMILPTV